MTAREGERLPRPGELPSIVFRALYSEFELRTLGGLHVAVPKAILSRFSGVQHVNDGPSSRVVDTVIWGGCPRRTRSRVIRVTCASPLVAAAFCSASRARSLHVDMSMTKNRRSQPRSGGMLEITFGTPWYAGYSLGEIARQNSAGPATGPDRGPGGQPGCSQARST